MGINIIPTSKPYSQPLLKSYSKTDSLPLPVCTTVCLVILVVIILAPYPTMFIDEFNIVTRLVSGTPSNNMEFGEKFPGVFMTLIPTKSITK